MFLLFVTRTDVDFLNECGFLKVDINRLCLEFKTIVLEQNEEYLDYIKMKENLFWK